MVVEQLGMIDLFGAKVQRVDLLEVVQGLLQAVQRNILVQLKRKHILF